MTGICVGLAATMLMVFAAVDQSYVGWDVEIGDADNDGQNEIVLATGKGDRTTPGTSYVVAVKAK